MKILNEYWTGFLAEAAAKCLKAQQSLGAASGSPSGAPAASSADAEEPSRHPTGEGVAADGGHTLAQDQELSQRGDDMAADAAADQVAGASCKDSASQGGRTVVRTRAQHVLCSSITERALASHSFSHRIVAEGICPARSSVNNSDQWWPP